MVDIHTHILPHMDDGAKNTDTAVAMLRAEGEQGTEIVVLTPHYYGRKSSPAQFLEKSRAAFERLRSICPEGLELRLGAEVHFTGMNASDYEGLCSLGIEGTQCILLEFPFTHRWTSGLLNSLADFIDETGYTPIIAHIERYDEVLKNPTLVNRLIGMGCLIQVNAQSFCNKYTKSFAFALLKHGLVHCIGSDAHDCIERSPDMREAKQTVELAGFSSEWERAQEIMKQLLAGGQVRVECGKPVKKFLGKYF